MRKHRKTKVKKLTKEEHRARHLALHKMLDELVADWIACGGLKEMRLPSKSTIRDLMEWSFRQTINPEDTKI